MRKFFCTALLALALFAPATSAQDSGSSKAQKDTGQTTGKAAKQKGKAGTDCEPNRAGVRCSRPKPRKPWFFGKA
jgi:hypothetical protein